jgi:hypothetical protein
MSDNKYTGKYYVEYNDREIRIYPAVLDDMDVVCKHFNNIRDGFIFVNFIKPKFDSLGVPEYDEDGDTVPDAKVKKSLEELLKIATKLSVADVRKFDVYLIKIILEIFMDASQLKKNLTDN